ncbi:MAG: MFS transporter [Blastocatellia bacterium]
MSEQITPTSAQEPVTKTEIAGWCMYDVADSAFTTVMITAFYANFFKDVIVGDKTQGTFLWGIALSSSEIVVALLAPILGAIADFAGYRKRFLAVCAVLIVLSTGGLWFAGPGMIVMAMALFIMATLAFSAGGTFIDSFLPGISDETNAGRISGIKWALGYLGGLSCVALSGRFANGIKPNPSAAELASAQMIPLIVAAWYAIAVIPAFIFLRERSRPQTLPPGQSYLTVGFRQLKQTFGQIRHFRDLFRLLIAFLVYNDGVVTVIGFAAVYAVDTIKFTQSEITTMFIILNVVAAVGALSAGWIADIIGQKTTIYISLALWIVAVVLAWQAGANADKTTFWAAAALVGIGMGSTQSVTRSLLSLFTPKERAAEFFGFLGIAGRALAFLGPLVFGGLTKMTGSQRPAILAIGVFFIVGMFLLSFVDEKKGREAALAAHS